MKILLINSLYYPNIIGGAEISVQTLAEELQKKGIETVVITSSNKNYVDFVNGVKVYYVHHSNIYWLYNAEKIIKLIKPLWHLISLRNPIIEKKLEKIIKSENPDIINTNNFIGLSSFFWKIIKKNKIPSIHTLNDYYLLCWKSTLFSGNKNCNSLCLSCKLFSLPKKFFSKDIDAVIGITEYILKRHIDKGFFRYSKKFTISSPINIPTNIYAKEMVKKPLTFAFIGLISKTKGIEKLLETFVQFNYEARLLILGRAKNQHYEKNLKLNYSSENINFLGFVNIAEFMSKIDVLIVPSLWNEPFGRVIIEAYSYGIPVIGSSRGGIPELIDEGRTGFIFDPDKNGDLESKLKIFIDNPGLILQMSKNCIEEAKKYSSEEIADRYIEVYKSLLLDKY